MISLKRYFLSVALLLFALTTSHTITRDYYRSNANGLTLLKIRPEQIKDYSFVVLVDSSGDMILSKLLYKDSSEIKKWNYTYNGNLLDSEYYYKNRVLTEESKYDNLGHKIIFTEYLNGKAFKRSRYTYNKDGVVDREEVFNLLTRETNVQKYKYDKNFRIKQIEKKTGDRTVYWESFYTDKGIILKEYYSLKDELFTFYYNESGQELKGEVKQLLPDKTEKTKLSWENFFSKDGIKERREEEDFINDRRIKTWYNKNARERRVESYVKNSLESVEEFEYNDKEKVAYYKKVYDLNLLEIRYKYGSNNVLVESETYEDRVLKKDTKFNPDGSRIETVYSKSKMKLTTTYDKDGNIVKEE